MCARKVAYSKLATPPDEDHNESIGFTGRGSIMEDSFSVPMMTRAIEGAGGQLLYAGQSGQVTFFASGVPLSCTPDGLAVNLPREFMAEYGVPDIGKSRSLVVEFKSIDSRVRKETLPKMHNVGQTLAQIGILRAATKYKPDWGVVIYVDSSDWANIAVHPVKWDQKQFNGLLRRVNTIMKATDPNTLPPEGKISGGKECGTCQFAKRCLGFLPWVVDDDPRALDAKKTKLVEAAALVVHTADKAVDKARLDKLAADAKLYEVLNKVGRKFVMGKHFVANAKATASQNRYDAKKLAAALKKLGGDPEKCRSLTKPGTSISVEAR